MSATSPCANSVGTPRYTHRELFRLLDDAAQVLGLPDAIHRTAQILIRFIPSDTSVPVSPVRVQELAELRSIDPRTVRVHIRRLIAFGLVADRSLAGGHRCVRRSGGRIVALHGIDFSPMLARVGELRAGAARLRHELGERIRLRGEISALRRRFRLCAGDDAYPEVIQCFTELPRRYAHLPFAVLTTIRDQLLRLIAVLMPLEDDLEPESSREAGRPKISDQSEEYIRPNSLKESNNPVVPREAVLTTLPQAWENAIHRGGPRTWAGLIATAYARSIAIGIPRVTWDLAVSAMGPRQTALLALAAEGEAVRCPAAWMRSLARRAGAAPLDLSMNLQHLKPPRYAHA